MKINDFIDKLEYYKKVYGDKLNVKIKHYYTDADYINSPYLYDIDDHIFIDDEHTYIYFELE